MSPVIYSFESLLSRISLMSDEEIMAEYVNVIGDLRDANTYGALFPDDYDRVAEPLSQAAEFLAGYLAAKVCYDNGFELF